MSLSSSPATIDIRLPNAARLALLIPVALAIFAGWFSIRWLVASTVSEVATTGENVNVDLAHMAVRWAPDDPFVHWRLGALMQREYNAENVQETLREYKTAVALSPNDFRYWDELGRAFEAAGDRNSAEQALRHSTDLAPNYYYPRWHLGNLLLRQSKFEEAFPHLFRAAEANKELWPQVLNLAWQAYDGDVDRIANEACKDPAVRISFAVYLVGVQRFDDALRLWKTLSPEDRARLAVNGSALRKAFLEAKRFHAALEMNQDIDPSEGTPAAADTISNGSFEEPLTLPTSRSFRWTISSNVQANTSIVNEGHTGRRSLRIELSAANKLERISVWQTVAVEPNTSYHFECYARTEKLKTASAPLVIVLDGTDQKPLAYSSPLPTGTNDWQKISLNFKTKAGDGIIVMIGRMPCSVGDICPIFGTVWYDDFILQRGGNSDSPRRSDAADTREGHHVIDR